MHPGPSSEEFQEFRGTVRRATPGVAVGSLVVIEREGGGWHLFVTPPVSGEQGQQRWDVWCDEWSDAEEWFEDWAVTWTSP
jgi:hypothetical protein